MIISEYKQAKKGACDPENPCPKLWWITLAKTPFQLFETSVLKINFLLSVSDMDYILFQFLFYYFICWVVSIVWIFCENRQ